jgi:hypothetical protein
MELGFGQAPSGFFDVFLGLDKNIEKWLNSRVFLGTLKKHFTENFCFIQKF